MNINKVLREKENIIPFENYEMLKSSAVGKASFNNGNKLPSIKYSDYVVKSSTNKNICLYLDSSEKLIEEFWKALALCHDCSIQNGEYIGMSPDNLELVKSASLQGFKFDVSDNNTQFLLSYLTPENNSKFKDQQRFEKLRQIEFSSDRKRESVIVKEGSLYKLYIKGADSIIEERLDESTPKDILEKSRYFVNLFSAQGYRTLYIAMKVFMFLFIKLQLNPILYAVDNLSPVSIHILISACLSSLITSGTFSCNLSSTIVEPIKVSPFSILW